MHVRTCNPRDEAATSLYFGPKHQSFLPKSFSFFGSRWWLISPILLGIIQELYQLFHSVSPKLYPPFEEKTKITPTPFALEWFLNSFVTDRKTHRKRK